MRMDISPAYHTYWLASYWIFYLRSSNGGFSNWRLPSSYRSCYYTLQSKIHSLMCENQSKINTAFGQCLIISEWQQHTAKHCDVGTPKDNNHSARIVLYDWLFNLMYDGEKAWFRHCKGKYPINIFSDIITSILLGRLSIRFKIIVIGICLFRYKSVNAFRHWCWGVVYIPVHPKGA